MSYTDGAGFGIDNNKIGVWKYTASEIKAKAEEVHSAARALAREIIDYGLKEQHYWFESNQLLPENIERHDKWMQFQLEYEAYYTNDWSLFYSKITKEYSIPSLFDSNVKAIMDYAKRTNEWRKKYEEITKQKSQTPILSVEEKPDEPFLGIDWNKVFWAGAIFGGAWLAIELVKAVTQYKTSSSGKRLAAAKK